MTAEQHAEMAERYRRRYLACKGACEVYATLAAYHAERAEAAELDGFREGLHATQEIPAVSMHETIYERN